MKILIVRLAINESDTDDSHIIITKEKFNELELKAAKNRTDLVIDGNLINAKIDILVKQNRTLIDTVPSPKD